MSLPYTELSLTATPSRRHRFASKSPSYGEIVAAGSITAVGKRASVGACLIGGAGEISVVGRNTPKLPPRDITIAFRLEVIGKDTILVPGCEPESTLTSRTLSMSRRCRGATVKLGDALAAIPGSTVEYQVNCGMFNGSRKKWFILPGVVVDCPCNHMDDYYAILRDLAGRSSDDDIDDFSNCEVNNQGFSPPKVEEAIPPVSTYQPEGTYFGILPAIWNPDLYGMAVNPTVADLPLTF